MNRSRFALAVLLSMVVALVPCASAHGVREWCLTYRIPHVHMVVLPPCSQETSVDELVEFFTACHLRGVRSVAGECEL